MRDCPAGKWVKRGKAGFTHFLFAASSYVLAVQFFLVVSAERFAIFIGVLLPAGAVLCRQELHRCGRAR
jgi:hypothetical protein